MEPQPAYDFRNSGNSTLVELSVYKFTNFQASSQLMFTVTGQFDEVFLRKTIFLFQEDECCTKNLGWKSYTRSTLDFLKSWTFCCSHCTTNRCQDRIPQSVDGLGDQNSPSGFLPEFVSFLTVTALNQKTLNHNNLYTLVTNRSARLKQS